MSEKLTLKQKMTHYTSDFINIEKLIFKFITCCILQIYIKVLCNKHNKKNKPLDDLF